MTNIRNKTVLITGASSGFGLASAAAYAKKGARLILAARRIDRLKKLSAELKKKYGCSTHVIQLDVRNSAAVKRAVNGLPRKWQAIDILLNNAGLSRGLDKLHEGSLQDWEEMIDGKKTLPDATWADTF